MWDKRREYMAAIAQNQASAVPVTALPFTDAFTRANGAIGNGWTGATWEIATNAAKNTPTLGTELITNGTFATDLTGWTDASAAGGSIAWNAGGYCDLIRATGQATARTSFTTIVGQWYRLSLSVLGGTSISLTMGSAAGGTQISSSWIITGDIVFCFRAVSTTTYLDVRNTAASTTRSFDTVSCKQITFTSTFATVPTSVVNVTAQVVLPVLPTDYSKGQAGVIVSLDSTSNPQNYVIGYHDGTNARLVSCVAGTQTQNISAAATYGAGFVLKVVKSGDTYQLFYNGVQIGTDQTIAGLTGTIHGMFDTLDTVRLDTYSLEAT